MCFLDLPSECKFEIKKMNKKIAIIGAGISGLTCALAFEKLGYTVTLFESTSEINSVGAGLGLAGNAIGAFKVLGIDKAVISCGKKLDSFPILDQKGRVITSVSFKKGIEKFDIENLTIHRADLHKVLLSQLKTSEIITGKRLRNIDDKGDYYRLYFEDLSDYKFEWVIGADGINSKVRTFINPNSKIRFAGYDCWRGVIDNDFGIQIGSETWGRQGRFGMVPLANNKLYWFLCRNRKSNKAQNLSRDELSTLFEDYHTSIRQIIEGTPEDAILFNPIVDLEPHKIYSKGKILLIGDAAHATTPNLGQGACQAIEDVAFLYQLLKKESNLEIAFNTFTKKRLKRTHFIVNTSWKIGKVAQFENPILIAIRNSLFRIFPNKVNIKQLKKVIYAIDYEL